MHRRAFSLGLLAAPAIVSSVRAATSTVRIARQYGLPYLPLMVMERERLVEKHAADRGLKGMGVQWVQLGGTGALVDGLLSGQLDFAVAGVTALLTMWDKTVGTPREMRGLSAVQSQPYMLVTNNAKVKTIADFGETDRIALPAVKLSSQAVTLEMAAAKQWGEDQYAKLDPLTVTLPHPDAMASVLSGKGAVNSHNSVAPYYTYELADKNVHLVLKSYDTIGKHTNGAMLGSVAFTKDNPELTLAVLAAQEEANAFIRGNPVAAAKIYIELAGDKTPVEPLARIVADPDNDWTTAPAGSMTFANFLHKVGRMKHRPDAWQDLFLAAVHDQPGT